jgi:hypothetical protein
VGEQKIMLRDFFKLSNPNLWAVIITIFGTIYTVYGYYEQRRVGLLSYQIQTQKIFDPADLRNFKLVNERGIPIDRKVYASELLFWNSGDLSISAQSDRIREPLKVNLTGEGNFFYFNVASAVPSSDNYSLMLLPDAKTYEIKWKYLDPQDGFKITFVHSGESQTKVTIDGRFFETSFVNEVLYKKDQNPWTLRILLLGFILFSLMTGGWVISSFRSSESSWIDRGFSFLCFSFCALLTYSLVLTMLRFHVPPF